MAWLQGLLRPTRLLFTGYYSGAPFPRSWGKPGIINMLASGNRAANLSGGITAPESDTSVGSTSVQTPPFLRMAKARPSSRMTAGRYSQFTRNIAASSFTDRLTATSAGEVAVGSSKPLPTLRGVQ